MAFDQHDSAASVARALGEKKNGNGYICRCPVPGHGRGHGDRSPSLSVSDGDGRLLVHCFAGCDPVDVLAELRRSGLLNGSSHQGSQFARMRQERQQETAQPKPFYDRHLTAQGYENVATYDYVSDDGELLYQVIRYEHATLKKEFLQRRPDGNGGWFSGAGNRKVLYRWLDLAQKAHNVIFVTEGEKDADRLASLGFLTTTVASGAWSQEAIEALAGYECFILEDNDHPGRKRAQKAAEALFGCAECVRIVRLPELAEKEDVSDWLDHGNDPEGLISISRDFPMWGTSANEKPELDLPIIDVSAGDLPRMVAESEKALGAARIQVYRYGDDLVRPTTLPWKDSEGADIQTHRLTPISTRTMQVILASSATYLRHDKRAGRNVPTDPPTAVAEALLQQKEWQHIKAIYGLVQTPFMRPDGSLCDRPGYDAATGLLFASDGTVFPTIHQQPTKDDALVALAVLKDAISTFPFADEASRSVILSGFLSVIDRRAGPVPLTGIDSPVAANGKSLLTDVLSIVATGWPAAVVAPANDEGETEKRLGAQLMQGASLISIDNVTHPLESLFLCQALTQPRVSIRVLGQSKVVEVPINTVFFCNGNGLQLVGDLTRRALLCTIDAKVERPELRRFDGPGLRTIISRDRGRLVAAALTILRAWHLARVNSVSEPIGSFEVWSRRTRDALIWLGEADPCDTMSKLREFDPSREAHAAVVEQWKRCLVIGQRYRVQQLIHEAEATLGQSGLNDGQLKDALLAVAMSKSNASAICNKRLGRWLQEKKSKIINGHAICHDGQ